MFCFEVKFLVECVVMMVGVGGVLNVVLKSIVNLGDEVIIFVFYFVEYKLYIENYGGKVVSCLLIFWFEIDIDVVR